jgi:hypothetical protein
MPSASLQYWQDERRLRLNEVLERLTVCAVEKAVSTQRVQVPPGQLGRSGRKLSERRWR